VNIAAGQRFAVGGLQQQDDDDRDAELDQRKTEKAPDRREQKLEESHRVILDHREVYKSRRPVSFPTRSMRLS